MRLWITCLLILLTMLASLSVVQNLAESFVLGNVVHVPSYLPLILLIISVTLMVCQALIKRTKPSAGSVQANIYQAKIYHRILSLTPLSALIMQALIICLLVLGAGLQTVRAVQTEVTKQLEQPIRVLATVRPLGISDSNYYPSADDSLSTGYRQLAVIESVEPLTLNHFGNSTTQSSPSESPQIQSLQGKTVLLSARFPALPNKTNLPTGYSSDFAGLNQLQPTQSTKMMLALSPIPPMDEGFTHRWLRSRHVNAQAKVLAYQQAFSEIPSEYSNWKTSLNQWRWNIRSHFLQGLGNSNNAKNNVNNSNWANLPTDKQQALAVTLSLLTGDRALISKDSKNLYQLSGISHLLAISGTHVLFLAIILSSLTVRLVNGFVPRLYDYLPRSELRWLTMVFGALLYALFTGFDVPSARTVYMLMAVGLARLLLLDISARQVLLVVAVLMAMYDPYVLWQAGFWLSFVAVMLLISYDLAMNENNFRRYNPNSRKTNDNRSNVAETLSTQLLVQLLAQFLPFFKLQLWIFVALLPLSLLLFGKVSLWGVLVNLFAIAFYGWIIVPLNLLAGVIYLLLPSVADVLWGLVSWLLQGCHGFLAWLVGVDELGYATGQGGQAWLYTNINVGMMLIMGLMFLPMLLPRHSVSRVWSLPPLVLLLILLFNQENMHDDMNRETSTITKSTATTITLLNTQLTGNNRHISSLLVSHDDENWLIVANHGFAFRSKKINANASNLQGQQSQLLTQWQNALGENAISALTGIIVQTPSPELLQASLSLKSVMPVGFIWQAGNQHINGYSNKQSQAVSSCDMGKNWQSDDGKLSIKAMTGWQEIDDKGVWSCAISLTVNDTVDGNASIQINNQYPVYWAGKQTAYKAQLIEPSTKQPLKQPIKQLAVNQVIINAGGKSDKLWQLWALLCPTDNHNLQNHSAKRESLLLSHSYNDFPKALIKQDNSINNWLLLDKPSQYNQQKLPKVLLDWGGELEAD